MSTDTAITTCDWCDRPALRGFGPATGATHHICSVHDAAPDLLAALKEGLIDKFMYEFRHTTARCPNASPSPLDRDTEPCWACCTRALIARAEEDK